MLFVTHEDVRYKWTFTRQKGDRQLYGLAMPVFAVLSFEGNSANCFIQLVQKPELGAHAEVGDGEEAELLEYELA